MPTRITIEQFEEWVRFHGSLYAGFTEWINADLDTANEWYGPLVDYSLEELRAASRKHHQSPNGEKSTGFSYQLADMLGILRTNRHGAEVYSASAARYARVCGMCGNAGLLTVRGRDGFQFETAGHFALGHKRQKDGERGAMPAMIDTASVACKCQAGDAYRKTFQTFEAANMEPLGSDVREKNRRWLATLRSQGRIKDAERYQRFLDGHGSIMDLAVAKAV